MHGDEIHVAGSELSDRRADRLWNVKEFEVGEHLLVFGAKPVGQLEVSSGKEEFQADLVEGNGIGQRVDDSSRFRSGWNVQREDQPVGRGDRCGDRRLPKLLPLRARRSEFRSVSFDFPVDGSRLVASGGRSSFPARVPARGQSRRCRAIVSRETSRSFTRADECG